MIVQMKLPRLAPFVTRLLASLSVALLLLCNAFAYDASGLACIKFSALPLEAQRTISLIRQDGPFPYDKDGSTFGNYEKRLPQQKRGYYREFTVKPPHLRGRGAKRIIAGGWHQPPDEYYYTADHYKSFKRVID
jgi:ribonuclease T1